MADDDIRLDVEFDADEASARRAGEAAADAFQRAMEKSLPAISASIRKAVTKALSGSSGGADSLGDSFDRAANDVKNATAQMRAQLNNLNDDIAALGRRADATKATLRQLGADPNLFEVINVELQKLLRLQDRLNREFSQGFGDPAALRAVETELSSSRVIIGREVTAINQQIRSLTANQKTQGNLAVEALRGQNNERVALLNRARSEFVAISQREGAQTLAETRVAGQRQIQAQRQFQRTRIEVLRFTLAQVRVIERGIAAAFRATATVAQGAFARVENTVFRIGRVFRRSNTELNDGLRGALLQRERTIERSFSRQTQDIRQATIQQSRLIQRLETQASRGVAGAVTGRSGLGALVGGGLAFGGGFLLIDKLREGFDESVNLNEALNKTQQIFGDATNEIVAFADSSVEALFVTQSAALEAAANFGIFGKAAGLTGGDLADFSKTLSVLATDMASFNNTEVDDAVTAISAALRGEQEPIRKYGVLLNEAVLQERAFADGVTEVVRKLTPAERVLAAYSEILAQTVDQQGDAARTADDFANSSRRAAAASTETFAAIAENLVPIAERITNFAFPALTGLTAFIRDETGPVLSVVRDGLIGAAGALTGLLAAKVAGEAIQFLALALRAAATPLGLFITAVAGVGAAINVLRQRSPEFRIAISQIGDAIGGVLGAGVDLAVDGIRILARTITDVVLPVVVRFADFVQANLRRALEIGFGFIVETVIPAVERFASFLTGTAIPAVIDFGEAMLDRVSPALRTVRDIARELFDVVLPRIQPAIDGFRNLGSAIAGALGGDFSGIIDGLRGVGTGLADTFATIGVDIYNALRPQIDRAVRFVADAFRNIDFAKIGATFLDVVELIGRTLGTIVSDRRFVLALEAIVAAAVITGVRFIKGFVEGVISNLPELADLFGGQIKFAISKALEGALDPGFLARVIIAAFAAVAIGTALLQTFRRPVQDAGQKAGVEFSKSFAGQVRNVFRRNDFASGFFGGAAGLERSAKEASARMAKAFATEQRRAADRLKVLGQAGLTIGARPGGQFGPLIPTDAVKDLETQFGKTTLAGAELRERTNDAFRQIGIGAQGLKRVVQGEFRAGFSQATTAAQGFSRQVGGILRTLATNFRETGIGVGQALGGAIVSGVGAALSGRQLGEASGAGGQALGLAGIISSALFSAAAVGGGPQGIAVGTIVAGIGLVSAAISNSGQAAKEAAERTQAYVDILERVGDVTDAFPDIESRITDVLAATDERIRNLLESSTFTVQQITPLLEDGVLSAAEALGVLGDAFDLDTSGLLDRAGGIDASFGDIANRLKSATFNLDEFRGELDDAGISAVDFERLFQLIRDEADALGEAGGLVDFKNQINDTVQPITDATKAMTTVEKEIDKAVASADRLGPATEESGRTMEETFRAIVDRILPDVSDETRAIDQALGELNQRSLDRVQQEISDVGSQLSTARDAAQLARDSLTDYLTGNYSATALADVDQLVGQIGSVGSTIEEALSLGGQRGESALAAAVGGFESQIARVIQQGFADGLRTPEEFSDLLRPFYAAIQEEVADAGKRGGEGISDDLGFVGPAAERLRSVLDRALNDEALTAGVAFVTDAEAEVARLQDELNLLNAELEVELVFNSEQVRDALRDLGLDSAIPGLESRFRSDFAAQNPQVPGGLLSEFGRTTGLAQAQSTARQASAQIPVSAPVTARADVPPTVIQVEQNIYGQSDPQATARRSVRELQIAASGFR